MGIPPQTYQEVHLLPSILSADFARLGEQVALVMDAGAAMIHVDVMDGHFVPNLSLGPAVVQSLAPLVHERGGLLSVHLMIEHPGRYIETFVNAGADALSVHVETCRHLYHVLSTIQEFGAGAGVALNPGTPICAIEEAAQIADFVLVMTVNPGFGGQKMITSALSKVKSLRASLPATTAIEVDGGVHEKSIREVCKAGGNWIVAGSAVFGTSDPAQAVRSLHELMASC